MTPRLTRWKKGHNLHLGTGRQDTVAEKPALVKESRVPIKDPEKRRRYQREYYPGYRQDKPELTAQHDRSRKLSTKVTGTKAHRFVGVDGEGWTDENGIHHYMCLVAGEHVLYTGKPLRTYEILAWIVRLGDLFPGKDTVLVGFFFDYDVTMILRDILTDDPDVMTEIVTPYDEKQKHFSVWKRYSIQYVPRKHLSVRLKGADRGTTVTIHDTRSFFQCSFVKALKTYGVGDTETVTNIERMKKERARFRFPDDAPEIIRYCQLECALLADLTAELRDRFTAARLSPWPYEGPGPVAGTVLQAHGFRDSRELVPDWVADLATQAYYGGRFETLAHGTIAENVWEYDIRSAYPYAMTQLPCLKHGTWGYSTVDEGRFANPSGSLWVGHVRWDTFDSQEPMGVGEAGPLPWRYDDGGIMFPAQGRGVYWSVEVPPYAVIDGPVAIYRPECDCRPFAWVPEMYQRRREMEAEVKGSGLPLKLVLNSLYGKFAQRIGKAPYFNPVWSGLITALTRAMVYQVYRNHPGKVVMFATDAVFVTEPCPELDQGSELGQWEEVGPYHDLTIFQPGVYFDEDAAKFKTRGVPYGEFKERAAEFIRAANRLDVTVKLPLTNHLGIRQCLAWGPTRYHDLGNWLPTPRTFRMHPGRKRRLQPDGQLTSIDGTKWSYIPTGSMDVPSTPYDGNHREELNPEQLRWEEGLPDHPEAFEADLVGSWDAMMFGHGPTT